MATRKTTPTKSKASASDGAAAKAKRSKKAQPQPEAAAPATPETVDSTQQPATLADNSAVSASVVTLAEAVTAPDAGARAANASSADANGSAGQTENGYSADLAEEISRLAYSYWEQRGYAPGDPLADWLRAEKEVRSRRVLTASA